MLTAQSHFAINFNYDDSTRLARRNVMQIFFQMTISLWEKKSSLNVNFVDFYSSYNTSRPFVWQDENEHEEESFHSFWTKPVTNKPVSTTIRTLKDRFIRHTLVPEQTKALVFVFVFIFTVVHEQAIAKRYDH